MLSFAAEIVRRAERGIGLAIRKGQAEGKIAAKGTIGGNRKAGAADDNTCTVGSVSKMRRDELARGPYAMADSVTDERFDEAIEEAKGSTVKPGGSPGRRKNVQGPFVRYSRASCEECEAPIRPGLRRPRRFCSGRCRVRRWHRQHEDRRPKQLLGRWLEWAESAAVS